MKLYSLQMKLQLYEITFSHLQLRTQKFESQCNPLTRSINKETPLQCNLCASYRLACFCLKKQIQIAQWTQTLSRFLGESYNFPGCPSRQNLESKPQLGKKKKKKSTIKNLPLHYLHYLTIFKWRMKRSFAIRPWNTYFELPCGFPLPPYNQPLTGGKN